jgi:hypothetical protein
MSKSKKQFTDKQNAVPSEEFGRAIELAFSDHPWPASREELLEHASRQGTFAKSDLARLKQIPHRDYQSIADLMDATRQTEPAMQGAGPVSTPANNRRAMGDMTANSKMQKMHSGAQYDEQIH